MKIKNMEISFKNAILIIIGIIYTLFTILIYFLFINFEEKRTFKQLSQKHNKAFEIASNFLEEEKETLLNYCKFFQYDDQFYHAMVNKKIITTTIQKTDNPKVLVNNFSKIKFLQLINNISKKMVGFYGTFSMISIQIFDNTLSNIANVSSLKKEFLDNGSEDYLKYIHNENKYFDLSTLTYKSKKIFIKSFHRYKLASGYYGIIEVFSELDKEKLFTIRNRTNCEIILLNSNFDFLNSTLDGEIQNEKNLTFDKDKNFFKLTLNNTNYFFTSYILTDYNQKPIGKILIGNNTKKVFENYFKKIKEFRNYQLFFSLLLLIILYFILFYIFKPFGSMLKGIKEVDKQNYNINLPISYFKDINKLSSSINTLSKNLKEREIQLLNKTKAIIEKELNIQTEKHKREELERLNQYILSLDSLIVILYNSTKTAKIIKYTLFLILLTLNEILDKIYFFDYFSDTQSLMNSFEFSSDILDKIDNNLILNKNEKEIIKNLEEIENSNKNEKEYIRINQDEISLFWDDLKNNKLYNSINEKLKPDKFNKFFKNKNIIIKPIKTDKKVYGTLICEFNSKDIKSNYIEIFELFCHYLEIYFLKNELFFEKINFLQERDLRCTNCNSKLCEYKGEMDFIEIKCQRCGTLNVKKK